MSSSTTTPVPAAVDRQRARRQLRQNGSPRRARRVGEAVVARGEPRRRRACRRRGADRARPDAARIDAGTVGGGGRSLGCVRAAPAVASGSRGRSPVGVGEGRAARLFASSGIIASSARRRSSNESRRLSCSVTRQSRTSARRGSGSVGATSSMFFGCVVAMVTMSALKFGAVEGALARERLEEDRRRRRRRRSARRCPRRPWPARGSCRAASRGRCRRR